VIDRSSLDPLVANAARDPDGLALVDAGNRLSWAGLLAAADATAAALARAGVRPGDRVAVLASAGAPLVSLVHGVRRMGGVLVPLGGRAASPELAWQLEDSAPALLVRDATHAALAASAVVATPGASQPSAAATPRASAAAIPMHDLAVPPTHGTGRRPGPSGSVSRVILRDRIEPDAPSAILYTSGTTGRPKGAVLTWGNHLASAAAWASILDPLPTDRWLLSLPAHHVAGLATILRPAIAGVPLVLAGDGFDADRIARLVVDERVSHLSVVAATLERLLDATPPGGWPPSLRAVLLGGGPTSTALVLRALHAGLPIVPSYGMTETASGIAALPTRLAAARPGSAGRALAGVDLRVEIDGRAAAPGEVGEIVVGGAMVFAGYHDRPDDTAAVIRDGRLHTGDAGALDADGLLTVMDRRDDLIVSGGENVYPAEVEAILNEHPAVRDAGVVGLPDARWGAVPVAAIVPVDGEAPTDDEMRAFVGARLASFKVPARIERLEVLPRTAGGKLRRSELRARLADGGRRTLRRDGAEVAYRVEGAGPPVVLLHATLSRASAWRGVADGLRGSATLVAVDRRGHRASPDPDPMRLTVADHVADVAAIIEREGIGPSVVVGHSFGGCVALELAARRPELVSAVVAYEPPYLPAAPRAVRDGMTQVATDAGAALARGDGPGAAEIFLRAVLRDDGFEALPRAVRASVLREGEAAASDARLAGLDPTGLRRIRCPVTIAVGGASDPIYAAIAEGLSALVPAARVVVLPGADHMAAVTRPDLLVPLVVEALRTAAPPPPPTGRPPADSDPTT
jgi:O-succinylbenzoic acid--CoA ligase